MLKVIDIANKYAIDSIKHQSIVDSAQENWFKNSDAINVISSELYANLFRAAWFDTWVSIFRIFPEDESVIAMKKIWNDHNLWTKFLRY